MLLQLRAKYVNLEVNDIETPTHPQKNSNRHIKNILYSAQPTLQ